MRQGDLLARPYQARDAERVAMIYNEGIADRVATFETEPRSAATIARDFAARAGEYPAIVVERDRQVVGVAWTSQYRPRPAYAGVAEVSIYVARAGRGRGVGRQALSGLIEAAEARGFWKLVSRVFPENQASRRLCAAAGFREVGIYRRHGRLDGRWRDCVIVERLLGDALRD